MNLMLQGKVAMVAASSRGLGFGVAKELAREGVKVSIASRDLDAAEKAATQLRAETDTPVLASQMDAKDPAAIANWKQARTWKSRDAREARLASPTIFSAGSATIP